MGWAHACAARGKHAAGRAWGPWSARQSHGGSRQVPQACCRCSGRGARISSRPRECYVNLPSNSIPVLWVSEFWRVLDGECCYFLSSPLKQLSDTKRPFVVWKSTALYKNARTSEWNGSSITIFMVSQACWRPVAYKKVRRSVRPESGVGGS